MIYIIYSDVSINSTFPFTANFYITAVYYTEDMKIIF